MQKVLYSTQDEIFALDISADGSKVISAEYEGQVHVHDIEGGSVQHLTGLLGWSADIAYSPDSNKAAAWNMDGDIWIWDTQTGERAGTLKGQKNKWGMALAWSPEGTLVAAGRVVITIWDIESKNKVQTLEGHKGFIRDLIFSPDGQHLASACMDKTVRVWDINTGKVLYSLQPQGLVIYLKSGPAVNPISLPISAVAFSPDGKKLATGGADRVVRVWDAATGELLHEYKGHRMSITAVAFSPDGARLLSSSLDHTIRVWDAE
jgi:WD40 repeat protein